MPHLAVSGVRARYGTLEVLKGVSFSMEKGEVLALVGPSGSGKSTVLRALVGLTPVTAGSVEIHGTAIDYRSAASVRAARDQMAIVFQQYNLFQNMNVLRNVTLAPVKIKGRPARRSPGRGAKAPRHGGPCRQDAKATPTSFRAASSSAWPSPARWRSTPRSCFSTRSPPRSTPSS